MPPLKKHKVLLYNPEAVFFDMPLALLSIGSALDPARFDVRIIDARIEPKAHELALSEAADALCLGVTVLTGRPIFDALKLTQKVKAAYPHLPVVWGGWHPSLFPTETLRDEPAIDVTVQGQGEETFSELVQRWASQTSIDDLEGIAFRNPEGQVVKNPGRPLKDMNFLPPVNYDLIPVERYFIKKKRRQWDYISSTGCRFRCTFCADPQVFSRNWTAIEPERMGDELAFWKKRYGFDDVNFQDETFFTKRRRVEGVAHQFLEKNLQATWAGTLRADQASRMTEADFDLCKRSGLRRVLIGVEAGTQEMLDWLAKDIKIEQVLEAAERCRARDIHVIFPFIIGFPNETEDSFVAALTLARKLQSMYHGFTTPIFFFKPYPGSKITQEVVAQGYQLPQTLQDWAEFDYIGSSGPWVSPQKFALVERFKFYNRAAGRKNSWLLKPIEWMARQRLRTSFFDFPIEKIVVERFAPKQALS